MDTAEFVGPRAGPLFPLLLAKLVEKMLPRMPNLLSSFEHTSSSRGLCSLHCFSLLHHSTVLSRYFSNLLIHSSVALWVNVAFASAILMMIEVVFFFFIFFVMHFCFGNLVKRNAGVSDASVNGE